MAERPVRQGAESRLMEYGQEGRRGSTVQDDCGGGTVGIVCVTDGGAEVFEEHSEPGVAYDGGADLRHRDTAQVREAQGQILAVEGLLGVLEDRRPAVGEGHPLESRCRPQPDLLPGGCGPAGEGAQVGQQGGGEGIVHERCSWSGEEVSREAGRPARDFGWGSTRPKSRAGRGSARSRRP